MLFKNVSNQKIHIYAYDSTTGAPKTGDAANITAYVALDGTANAVDDPNPTEVDATNMPGLYCFDLAQAETNSNAWALVAKSSTANIRIEPIIGFTTGEAVTQTGDSYPVVSHADYGLDKLVRSTTPANKLGVDADGKVAVPDTQKVDVETLKTKTLTVGANVTIRADVGHAAEPGAANGALTTNGTKINQTADLTAGQSIACSDKTGFSLSATGADLILKSSTFVQAIVAAVNELATYGLTALNNLLVTTGIKTSSTAAPTDMAKDSTVAKSAELAKVPKSDSNVSFNAAALSAISNAIADEIYDNDGSDISLREATRIILSVLSGLSTGGGTATLSFRDLLNTKNRVRVTVDANGNRTVIITRDGT